MTADLLRGRADALEKAIRTVSEIELSLAEAEASLKEKKLLLLKEASLDKSAYPNADARELYCLQKLKESTEFLAVSQLRQALTLNEANRDIARIRFQTELALSEVNKQ